jgi:ABC-type xylose transport system permease subunit
VAGRWGYGIIAGTLIGALTLTVLLNGLVILGVPPEIQTVVQGLILIVAVWISLDRRKIGIIK